MAIENEFLPMLNSWPLFALVVAVMLGYCFIQYITPHLREWHEEKKQAKQK